MTYIKPPTGTSVRAQRRSYLLRSGSNYPALWRAGLRVFSRPVLHHAGVQPLADEPQQHSVTYPLAHDVPQLAVFQSPEEVSDIDLKNPLARHLHRLALHDSQRLMRGASGPEAV